MLAEHELVSAEVVVKGLERVVAWKIGLPRPEVERISSALPRKRL